MSDEPNAEPSAVLSAMRASIDAVDHAIVSLLAERRALVAEVFSFKKRHGLPFVDPGREERLLAERSAFAEAAGVPPALAARVFQAILEASRDEAAAAENLARGEPPG